MFGNSDEDRLEPVLGPGVAPAAENERDPTIYLVIPAERPSSLGAVRLPRRPLRGLLRMRYFSDLIKGLPKAEEHPKGASRSTHDRDAPLLTIPEAGAPGWMGRELRVQVKEAGRWTRLRGPVGSLILHLLPLLLLIDWPMSPPAEVEPIPMQLVFEPPPKAVPAPPLPQPKPTPPPPRGRLASEDLGEPEAKQVEKPKGAPPAAEKPAKTEPPPAETKPPEKPQQTAALAPPPLPQAKPDAPKPDPVPKPAPKPTPAAH